MRIFFTQRPRQLKPVLFITLLSFLPYQATSSNHYWDMAYSARDTICSAVNESIHQFKYSVVSVSSDHFPELILGQFLKALEENHLEKAKSAAVCQNLHFDYMKNEYPGRLSFNAIDFGIIVGETRYNLSSSQTLHAFLSNSVPKNDLTKSFRLLNPEMSPEITVGEKSERWKKSCLYEYVLSNPPTQTDYKRVYIRLTAWRTKK